MRLGGPAMPQPKGPKGYEPTNSGAKTSDSTVSPNRPSPGKVSPRIDETFPGDEFKRVVVPMITRVMPHLVKVHPCIGVSHIRILE